MKKLNRDSWNVNGKIVKKELFYELDYVETMGDFVDTTNFYDDISKKKKVKKYWLFGPTIEVPDLEPVFVLFFNVEDSRYTMQFVTEKIQEQIELLHRKSEIEEGVIVEPFEL